MIAVYTPRTITLEAEHRRERIRRAIVKDLLILSLSVNVLLGLWLAHRPGRAVGRPSIARTK